MSLRTASKRLKALKKILTDEDLDGYLINQPVDIFYLTGIWFSEATLVIGKKDSTLFVDGRYITAAKKNPLFSVELIGPESLSNWAAKNKINTIGFDPETVTYQKYLDWNKQLQKKKIPLQPLAKLLPNLRMVKDEYEIRLLKKSAKHCYEGYQWIKNKLREGISEIELAKEFEIFCLERGAEKMSFDPIVAFGAHSALPHYHPGKKKLKKGDIVLLDLGACFNHYQSDMTRTLFFGPADPKLKKIYSVVKEAQEAALKKCKPGVKTKELDQAAREVMAREGLEHLFIHSLGHGIGLQTHEYPRLKIKGEGSEVVLEEGMVVTIEPGLYLPGKGGVRYEDTVVVTKGGYRNLYPS